MADSGDRDRRDRERLSPIAVGYISPPLFVSSVALKVFNRLALIQANYG